MIGFPKKMYASLYVILLIFISNSFLVESRAQFHIESTDIMTKPLIIRITGINWTLTSHSSNKYTSVEFVLVYEYENYSNENVTLGFAMMGPYPLESKIKLQNKSLFFSKPSAICRCVVGSRTYTPGIQTSKESYSSNINTTGINQLPMGIYRLWPSNRSNEVNTFGVVITLLDDGSLTIVYEYKDRVFIAIGYAWINCGLVCIAFVLIKRKYDKK
ncbi:MAG: hypothetical protein ACFFB5_09380 [Promethearchaeota archaeon]